MYPPCTDWLMGVWGSASDDVFAVGGYPNDGLIIHYDGEFWTEMPNPAEGHIRYVWGSAWNDVFAVHYSEILHYDGVAWEVMTTLDGVNSVGLWGRIDF